MARPTRSRQVSLSAVLRFAALVGVAAGVSVVASPLAGGVILAVGLAVPISYEATRPSGLLRQAEHAPHPHGGRRHVVVVADAPPVQACGMPKRHLHAVCCIALVATAVVGIVSPAQAAFPGRNGKIAVSFFDDPGGGA